MVITNLDLSIQLLKEYTLRMIEKCEDAVDLSVEYMMKKDIKSTKKLIRQDDDIDILREYIRDRSIELLVLKHQMARDLRYIYALGFIALEFERIGDYAVNIADFNIGNKRIEYVDKWIEISEEVGFEFIEQITMKLQTRRGNGHKENGQDKVKKEGIFVFKKNN